MHYSKVIKSIEDLYNNKRISKTNLPGRIASHMAKLYDEDEISEYQIKHDIKKNAIHCVFTDLSSGRRKSYSFSLIENSGNLSEIEEKREIPSTKTGNKFKKVFQNL